MDKTEQTGKSSLSVPVGFIGLGIMGKPIAERLLQNGIAVHIYARRKEAAEELIKNGAVMHNSIGELASHCRVIFTMVGTPADVEEVYLSTAGILNHAAADTLCVDMTTSSPELAKKLYQSAVEKGILMLDAPVSGGDSGAKAGTLSIMCGGDEAAFAKALPFFELIGEKYTLQGAAGAGQHTKIANQIAIAGTLIGVVEALRYAESAQLNPNDVLAAIGSGAAGSWQMNVNAPKMPVKDFAPGFSVKHFLKDLSIALNAAEQAHIQLPLLGLAQHFFDCMTKDGYAEFGTQALYDYYCRMGETV